VRKTPLSLLFFLLLLSAFICAKCKKDDIQSEVAKLPPITQAGKNTFGCLINGKAFTPSGYDDPYPNYRLDIDPGFDSGGFLLSVYSFDNDFKRRINIGSTIIRDTGFFLITKNSKTGIQIVIPSYNTIPYDSLYRNGTLKITRYDLQNGIFSGEFECKIYHPDFNDTLRITNGRFDKKL
jgi:hypothetical protein